VVRPQQRPDGEDRASGRRADGWLAPRASSGFGKVPSARGRGPHPASPSAS
jgi:hypothetical protein